MMKKVFPLLAFFLLINGCSKEKNKFELYNPQAFVFNLEPGWELNASVRAKGYFTKEDNNEFKINLIYNVNLVLPNTDTLKNVLSDTLKKLSSEKLSDVGIDIQIELDSTYTTGNYKIIINAKDAYSGQIASAEKVFNLTK
ncbi:hypothetical protein ABRY23_04350 [Melioribacteraceae bacterium 4301-Me]|uniref:hypothetical protein n=1 Tax=Pyranulibacter aquaticus TaxID=3163344 RepID=UPI00359A478B